MTFFRRLRAFVGLCPHDPADLRRERDDTGLALFVCECGYRVPQIRRSESEQKAVRELGAVRPYVARSTPADNVEPFRRAQ